MSSSESKISALMVESTRARIMNEGSIPYNPSDFSASFTGELGRLLNQEKAVNVFQSSRASHHKSKALNFEHRAYVKIVEHRFSESARRIADTTCFQTLSASLILLQTIIVGLALQTDVPTWLEMMVVFAFCGECLFIITGYGKEWWRYFTGLRRGKWESLAQWNTFDFSISFVSLAMMLSVSSQGGTVAVLRLLRAVRILKQLLGKQPGFIVIMAGARKGMDSVIYICCLLLFTIFVFGVVGVALFSENNPSAFGGLSIAVLTLLQCATLSNWHTLLYTEMKGCDKFGMLREAETLGIIHTQLGWFFDFDCVNPQAQPLTSILFFVLFTGISSFVVLSLIVGTVTLGMVEAVSMVQDIVDIGEAHDRSRMRVTHTWLNSLPPPSNNDNQFLYGESEETIKKMREEREHSDETDENYLRIVARSIALTKNIKAIGNETIGETIKRTSQATTKNEFQSNRSVSSFLHPVVEPFSTEYFYDDEEKKPHLPCFKALPQPMIKGYLYCSYICSGIVSTSLFEGVMMTLIVVMAVFIGLEASYPDVTLFKVFQNLIIWVFALEVVLKFVSEGRACQLYFYNPWNTFDFIVTLVALISLFELGSFNVSIFRLFRLMQLMRSLSKIVTLRVIAECLTRAIRPMRYIAIIFIVFNYLFGVLGVVMFQRNDPFHFGSLPKALLTIYRVETRQNWEKVMYLNMYGCDKYNAQSSGADTQHCQNSVALGWIACFYFVIVVVVGAILLPTLLVALITSCMHIAAEMVSRELRTLKMMHEEIRKYPEFYSTNRVKMLVSLFDHIDVDNSGTLTFEEVYPLMKVVDDIFYEKPEAAEQLFLVVDDDSSGEIEMSEFMHLFRNINRASIKVQEKTLNALRIRIERDDEEVKQSEDEAHPTSALKRHSNKPSFALPDEYHEKLADASFSSQMQPEGGSFVVNDDHLMVRELTAKAIARLILGDPHNLKFILDETKLPLPGDGLDDDSRAAIIDLFRESSVKVHKPLISHQGADTLHKNIEDAVKMQVGLGVCEKRDLPYAMRLVGLATKIDGMMWRDGAVRSPRQVEQLALQAEAALQTLHDRQEAVAYLNKEAKTTGYQACEGSSNHLAKSHVFHTLGEKEQVVNRMMAEERKSMEGLKNFLKWDGFEQWERKASLVVTHLQPSAKHETKDQSVIEFSQLKDFELPTMAHNEGGVFSRRPGWNVLAGQSAVREFRRNAVSKFCGTARRKVVRCLMESERRAVAEGDVEAEVDFETIEEVFKEMITNSNRRVTKDEKGELNVDHESFTHYLKVLMKKRNRDNKLELTEEEIGAVLLTVDTDCDGVISFKEFQNFLESADDLLSLIREVLVKFSLTPYGMPDLKAAFDYFDKNGTGVLEPDEFRASIYSLGYDISPYEMSRLYAAVDDNKGYVVYDDFVAMFFGTRELIASVRSSLEHLAVYGAPNSFGGGSGVSLFHRVIDELPRSHDASDFIKSLAKMRGTNQSGSYAYMKEEESEMDKDIIVSWAVLENALLCKLPLGLQPLDVKKVLMMVDLTGSGHCSLLLFERIFFKSSKLLEKMRQEFRERCLDPTLAVHPQVKMLTVAHKEGFHSDVPSLLLSENPDFFQTMLHPSTTLTPSEAAMLLYLTESSTGMINLPTLAHLVTDVYDITANVATARALRRYRGFLDVTPYPIKNVQRILDGLDKELECARNEHGIKELKDAIMLTFQPYQSDGLIAITDFPAVVKKLMVTYRNHSRAGYDSITGKRKFFGECSLEASALLTCALTSSDLDLIPNITAVRDQVSPPRLQLSEHEVNRLMAFLSDTEDGGGVSVERLISWLEEVEQLTAKLMDKIEVCYSKFDPSISSEKLLEGLKMEVSTTQGEVVEVSPRCALLGKEGSVFKDAGNYQDAVRVYKEKLSIEPASQHGLTLYMIGEIFCKQERWVEANETFEDAIACDPHLEFEFEVQLAAGEIEKSHERLRKATLELSEPIKPLYKASIGEKLSNSKSNTRNMFGRVVGKQPSSKTILEQKRDSAYEEMAKMAKESENAVKDMLTDKRTVWATEYNGRVMQRNNAKDIEANTVTTDMSTLVVSQLPCFEESIKGCTLVFAPNEIKMIVLEKERQGVKVVGTAKGNELIIKKASRYLGDSGTLVEFNITFDKERVIKYKGYIEMGAPKMIQGNILEVAQQTDVQSSHDILNTKAAYSSALVYINKGTDTGHTLSIDIPDEERSVNVRLLAARSLKLKGEDSRHLFVKATLCSQLPVTSQQKLTASAAAWDGEDLYTDTPLPNSYSEDPFLRIKVYNERADYKKVCIGEAEVSLKDVSTSLRTDEWFPLHTPGHFTTKPTSAENEEKKDFETDDSIVGEIRLILQKGDGKRSNLKDDTEVVEKAVVDGKQKYLDKKFGQNDEILFDRGVAYKKLGTFSSKMAEFAFHSDDRYGVLRAPFVVRSLGGTVTRGFGRKVSSGASFNNTREKATFDPLSKNRSAPPTTSQSSSLPLTAVGREPSMPPPPIVDPPAPSSILMNMAARQARMFPNTSDASASKIALLTRFLSKLAVNKGAMNDVLVSLPEEVRVFINSRDFTEGCQRKFTALCQSGQKSIPIESMMPILSQYSEGPMLSQSSELCKRFMRVFDEDRDGFIDLDEFLEINRFFFIVSCVDADTAERGVDAEEAVREVRKSYEEYVVGPSIHELEDLDLVLLTATQAHGFDMMQDAQLPSIETTSYSNDGLDETDRII